MAVLIEGMEMPKKPAIFCIHPTGTVYSEGEKYTAIFVQPHGRLGDLDRLEQMFADIDNAPYSGFDGTEPFYSAEDAAQIIRLAPTVIPASEEDDT